MPTMKPDQLAAYLEMRGLADTDGISRKARFRRCPWCYAITLQGLTADVAGVPVVCENIDLDLLAEAAVVLTGGRTYTVYELPGAIHINPRFAENMRAAAQNRPVVRAHTCGEPPPPSTANRWKAPIHQRSLHLDTAPPF